MTQQQRLTETEANEIGGAIHDLMQLDTKAIMEKDDAAKKRALVSFLQDKLVLHATEFLAAWFTMKHEYEPYLSAQASMLGNVMLIIQRRQQIQEARETAPAKTACECADPAKCPCDGPGCECTQAQPGNVVQLVTK